MPIIIMFNNNVYCFQKSEHRQINRVKQYKKKTKTKMLTK